MPNSPEGGYQPSAEEMATAEEMLTPSQSELSQDREKKAPARERVDELDVKYVGNGFKVHEGGHDVLLFTRDDGSHGAMIDGMRVGSSPDDPRGRELAQQLFDKYNPQVVEGEAAFKSSRGLIKEAQKEVRDLPRQLKEAEARKADAEHREKAMDVDAIAQELLGSESQ